MAESRADAATAAEFAEALEQDPDDGGSVRCWKALARVVDEEPTFVWQEGDSNGITIRCMILTGPFTGCEVQALLSAPLGGGLEVAPFRKGQRILIDLLDGRVDGLIVATASVPGGKEDPIPKSIAGVPLDSSGLENQADPRENNAQRPRAILFAPPKGIGHREYYRGAIKVIRLKGLQDDFFGGFVVSADDGTSIEMRWNSIEKSYLVDIKDKTGARLSVGSGFASLFSADGQSSLQVTNGQVLLQSDIVQIVAKQAVKIDGGFVMLNMKLLPASPANGAAYSVAGPANIISAGVFIGP